MLLRLRKQVCGWWLTLLPIPSFPSLASITQSGLPSPWPWIPRVLCGCLSCTSFHTVFVPRAVRLPMPGCPTQGTMELQTQLPAHHQTCLSGWPPPHPTTLESSNSPPPSPHAGPHRLLHHQHQNLGVFLDASLLLHSPDPVLHPVVTCSVILCPYCHPLALLFHRFHLRSNSCFPTQLQRKP